MRSYKQFTFSNTHRHPESGTLQKGNFTVADKPQSFTSRKRTIPLIRDGQMFWWNDKGRFQCYDIAAKDKVWSKKYKVSKKGRNENETPFTIALKQDTLIIHCYPYIVGLNTENGKERWKFEFIQSFESSHVLLRDNQMLIYAVDENIKGHYYLFDIEEGKVISDKEAENEYPRFLLGAHDMESIVVGHSGAKPPAAFLDKWLLPDFKSVWKKDYTDKSLLKTINQKLDKAFWQGRFILWDNKLLLPNAKKMLLCVDYETGDLLWEHHLQQEQIDTNAIGVSDEGVVYLIDDGQFVKLNAEDGSVISQVDKTADWEQKGMSYLGAHLFINGGVAAVGSIDEPAVGIIDLETGDLLWSQKLDFEPMPFSPILLDDMLVAYNASDGQINVFPIEKGESVK